MSDLTVALRENTEALRKGGPASGGPKPADTKNEIQTACRAFIENGGADGQAKRAEFLISMAEHFQVKKAGEIPEKFTKKVLKWLQIYEKNGEVDFDND